MQFGAILLKWRFFEVVMPDVEMQVRGTITKFTKREWLNRSTLHVQIHNLMISTSVFKLCDRIIEERTLLLVSSSRLVGGHIERFLSRLAA